MSKIKAPTTKQLTHYLKDFAQQHDVKFSPCSTRKIKYQPPSDYREITRFFFFNNEEDKERIKQVFKDVKMMLALSGVDADMKAWWRSDCVLLYATAIIA